MHKNFSALTMLGEWWYIHKERKHGEMERQSQCSCDTHTQLQRQHLPGEKDGGGRRLRHASTPTDLATGISCANWESESFTLGHRALTRRLCLDQGH